MSDSDGYGHFRLTTYSRTNTKWSKFLAENLRDFVQRRSKVP